MLDRFRYKLVTFMQGRYGSDNLGRFLLGVWFVFILLNIFFRIPFGIIIELAFLVVIYFRMFSKNIPARYKENQVYLKLKNRVIGSVKRATKNVKALLPNSQYHIYKCPGCSQKIRIPRGKGNIIVRCPRCGKEFKKKS